MPTEKEIIEAGMKALLAKRALIAAAESGMIQAPAPRPTGLEAPPTAGPDRANRYARLETETEHGYLMRANAIMLEQRRINALQEESMTRAAPQRDLSAWVEHVVRAGAHSPCAVSAPLINGTPPIQPIPPIPPIPAKERFMADLRRGLNATDMVERERAEAAMDVYHRSGNTVMCIGTRTYSDDPAVVIKESPVHRDIGVTARVRTSSTDTDQESNLLSAVRHAVQLGSHTRRIDLGQIPLGVLRQLSSGAMRIFSALSSMCYRNERGIARPGLAWIAKECGVSYWHASRCVKTLIRHRLIARQQCFQRLLPADHPDQTGAVRYGTNVYRIGHRWDASLKDRVSKTYGIFDLIARSGRRFVLDTRFLFSSPSRLLKKANIVQSSKYTDQVSILEHPNHTAGAEKPKSESRDPLFLLTDQFVVVT